MPPRPQLSAQLSKLFQAHLGCPGALRARTQRPACSSQLWWAALPSPHTVPTIEVLCIRSSPSCRYISAGPGPRRCVLLQQRGPSFWVGLVVCVGLRPSPASAAGPGAVAAWQLLPTLGVALGAQQTPAPGEQPVTKRTIFTELQSASMGYVCRVTETGRKQRAVHPTDPARKNTVPTRISQLRWHN